MVRYLLVVVLLLIQCLVDHLEFVKFIFFVGGDAAIISKVGLLAAVLFAHASDVAFGVAPIIVILMCGTLFAFAFTGSPDFDRSPFEFISASPIFSSWGSSGIAGVTVGIGIVAIIVGIVVRFNVFLTLERPLCVFVCF